MFEKFGFFKSTDELNKAAAGLEAEGDYDSLYELAKENGIAKEDAEDYIAGDVDALATEASAALGRVDLYEKAAKSAPMKVICTMIRIMIASDEAVRAAVMAEGKDPAKILKAMEEGARKHKNGNVGASCGTDRQLMQIIKAFYTEDAEGLKKRIEALY